MRFTSRCIGPAPCAKIDLACAGVRIGPNSDEELTRSRAASSAGGRRPCPRPGGGERVAQFTLAQAQLSFRLGALPLGLVGDLQALLDRSDQQVVGLPDNLDVENSPLHLAP